MAIVKIDYSELEESSKYAKKLSGELEDYADKVTKKIVSPIGNLPGKDSRGYAADIASSASAKIRELRNRSTSFNTFSKDVENFVSNAQQADKKVAESIKQAASGYVGERSTWQAFCDAVYNFLFVDFANEFAVVRFLVDVAKKGYQKVASFTESAIDWFQHGDGRYVWNIASAVIAVVGAVVGAVTAIAAVIAGGTVFAVVMAVIAAIAAVIGGIITIANAGIKIYNNGKALAEEDPGVARYVGGISGFSDMVDKYDMGSQEANEGWETATRWVEGIETVCTVIQIVKGGIDLGKVESSITGRVSYKFSKENIMTNIRKTLGFDFDRNKFTIKGFLGFEKKDVTKSWYANADGYGGFKWLMNRHTNTQNVINTIANANRVTGAVMDFGENMYSAYEGLTSGLDFSSTTASLESAKTIAESVIDFYEGMSYSDTFGGIKKMIIKPGKLISDAVERYFEKGYVI